MASLRREEIVRVSAEEAWAALRDVGMAHRLFADVLVDCRIEGNVRTVTFANGMIVRERIIDIDEKNRRVAYSVIDEVFEHHSASMEIIPDGAERCRFVWISDFLPNERIEMVAPLVEQGSQPGSSLGVARHLTAGPPNTLHHIGNLVTGLALMQMSVFNSNGPSARVRIRPRLCKNSDLRRERRMFYLMSVTAERTLPAGLGPASD